jgi:hypothetical protein
MAVTRIKNNQVTDASGANTQLGINANTKLQNYSITSSKLANNLTYGSDLTVTGNLTVQGNSTAIDTTITTIEDPIIVLASTQTSGAPAVDIGYLGFRGNESNIAFVWDESAGEFVTVFTSTGESNTTVTITSYANLHTGNANVVGNLTVGGNIDITGNIANLNVTGNISGGNLLTTGVLSAAGNLTGGNILTAGAVSATGNVTGGNVNTAGAVSATGSITSGANITGANILTGGQISATGNGTFGNISTAGTFGAASLSASGNVTGGNINTAGLITATGNVTGGNLLTGGVISATGAITSATTITGGNLATGGTVSATGNVTGGNILFGPGIVSGTGNIYGGNIIAEDAFFGNIDLTGDITVNSLTSNTFVSATGNVISGNLTTSGQVSATSTITGGNIATGGTVSATGNVTGGNVLTGGLISATSTITSASNITGGNILTAGVISATGNITGGNLLTPGLISAAGLATSGNIETAGYVSATGNVTALAVNTATLASSGGITISTTGANGNITITPNGTGNIVLGGNTYINGVSLNPVQDNDVASKYYVDTIATTGITIHEAVLAATNTTLATATGGTVTYNQPNGAANGIGATLTTTGTYTFIDTANVQTVGTRILVKDQANAVQNGVYVYSNATVITRSTDTDQYGSDSTESFSINDYFFTTGGNVNAGTAFVVSAPAGVITFGTSNIEFGIFSQSQVYTANTSAGLVLNGTVFSAKVDNNTTAFDGTGNISVKAGANLTTPNIGAATGTSLNATGNITGGNILTGGFVTATGNLAGGNVTTGGVVSATGNVTGNYFIGNGSQLTGVVASSANAETLTGTFLANNVVGSSLTSVGILTALSVSGTTTTGNLDTGGTVSATGNVTGGNILTAGAVSATGAITSATTITGGNLATGGTVSATGTGTFGNVNTAGTVSATGDITGGNVATAGTVSATGNITGGNISSVGVITTTSNITGGNLLFGSGIVSGTGNIFADTIFANISGNIDAGGANTEIQFNNDNVLAGSPGFTFNTVGNTVTANGNITGTNLFTGGAVSATGTGTFGNITVDTDSINSIGSQITVNSNSSDVNFAVNGDTTANVFYVDAGTGTASFGSATQTVNAVVAFNSTNSILAPVGNTAQRPATGVTGMLRFNTTNNAVEVYDNSQWVSVGVPVFTVIDDEQFAGDGSTLAFTLGSTQTTNSCIVSINGVVQIPTLAYSVSGTDPTCVLTFTEAPAAGDVIDVRQITTTTTVTQISNSSGNAVVSVSATAAQVNVTGDLSVNGTILGGNINSTAITSGTSNMTVVSSGGNIRANIAGTTVQTISAGLVAITGDLSVSGNATLSGNILGDRIQNGTTIIDIQTASGNANIQIGGTANIAQFTPTSVIVGANILPTANITYDIGSTSQRFKDIWLANSTIYLGNAQISANATALILTNPAGGTTVLAGTGGNVSGGNVTTAGLISATGNITGGNMLTGGVISATGNITGGNISATNHTGTTVSVTGAVTGAALTGTSLTVSTGNITAGNLLLSGAILDSGQLDIQTTASNGNIVLTPNGTGNVNVSSNIMPTSANATANIGSSTASFNTIFAKATSAQYADLAEKYTADATYAPGTVVAFGGTHEVTLSTQDGDRRVAGVISTNPSYRMNDGLVSEHTAMVALTGRVPTSVTGTVRKGDLMVSAGNGVARAEANPAVGTVIGKALADSEGDAVIEVVVGRV